MKKIQIATALISAMLVYSCGNESGTRTLDELISKRDLLKEELTEINKKIAELDTAKTEFTPIVSATEVIQKDFVHKVEVQGAVDTDQNVILIAESSGTIKVVHVKEGQKVSQGQALVTIDSEILQSSIDEVETALEMATYLFEKQEQLMKEGVGVEIEYEQAKNQKKSLEKKLKTMRSQKGKTVVRAPFSGVIDDLMIAVGDMASPMTPL